MPEVGGSSAIQTVAGAVSVHVPPTEQAPAMMEVIAHENPHRSKVLPRLQESIQYASTVVEIKPEDTGHTGGRRMSRVRIAHNAADPSALMLLSTEQISGSGGSASSVPSWVEWARGSDGNVRIGPSASPFDSATDDNDSFPAAEDVGARRVSRGEARRDSLRVNWYPRYVDIDAPDVRLPRRATRLCGERVRNGLLSVEV